MKITLTSLLLSVILLLGCTDDSSFLTSPETQINQQSNSPNWVKLPADLGGDFGVETEFSAEELIIGKKGGDVKLKFKIDRPDNELGDFEVKAKIKVEKYSFPDEEERLFTITLDPEYAVLNITPSPNTLFKHIELEWEIEGIDVSDINPDTFDFNYVSDNNDVLETEQEELTVDYDKHKLKVKKAIIHPHDPEYTPPGSRYGFAR